VTESQRCERLAKGCYATVPLLAVKQQTSHCTTRQLCALQSYILLLIFLLLLPLLFALPKLSSHPEGYVRLVKLSRLSPI